MSNFSEKIRDLRKRKGVSQAAIAEYLGITKQAYSLYETGKREPDFETLLQLAKYFDTDADS
ncbi:MAG: helix-turn-helix transcriptional regulator, partial [Ruminiclostridium sp.]|nr:helix-turn-helix transcriptional regulator [Ruminiclostridium sp.]